MRCEWGCGLGLNVISSFNTPGSGETVIISFLFWSVTLDPRKLPGMENILLEQDL